MSEPKHWTDAQAIDFAHRLADEIDSNECTSNWRTDRDFLYWVATRLLPVADDQPRASDETSIHPAGCGCVSCLAGYSEPSRALPGAEDAPAPILTPEQVAAMAAVARFVASIDVRDLCTSHEYLRSRVASLDAALAESNAAREGLDDELSRVSELLVAHDGESSHSTCSAHLAAILARSSADETRD